MLTVSEVSSDASFAIGLEVIKHGCTHRELGLTDEPETSGDVVGGVGVVQGGGGQTVQPHPQ